MPLGRLPQLHLAGTRRYRDSWHFHGLETLPIQLQAKAAARPIPHGTSAISHPPAAKM